MLRVGFLIHEKVGMAILVGSIVSHVQDLREARFPLLPSGEEITLQAFSDRCDSLCVDLSLVEEIDVTAFGFLVALCYHRMVRNQSPFVLRARPGQTVWKVIHNCRLDEVWQVEAAVAVN